jgi:hypothetical protein
MRLYGPWKIVLNTAVFWLIYEINRVTLLVTSELQFVTLVGICHCQSSEIMFSRQIRSAAILWNHNTGQQDYDTVTDH